jgi:hypothetical protein
MFRSGITHSAAVYEAAGVQRRASERWSIQNLEFLMMSFFVSCQLTMDRDDATIV